MKELVVNIRTMVAEDGEKFVYAFNKQDWHKSLELFQRYVGEQKQGKRAVFVAEADKEVAGYVTLVYEPLGPYADKAIPEIVDFNVLIPYQKQGIGTQLMNGVEAEAKRVADVVSLAVGLHTGYGQAQRLYIKRGYIPDGTGVWYQGQPLEPYGHCENDDDLVLYMKKELTLKK
ncbi:GNAT family N-acetyltransferase [Alkalihalobacillus pseudalcaliphilus]|uniref:GNAT family N-acetyltransferase n=1 Tax=Alkalihalobacillus pseudalcaliphilus TaxID=79884 RepID=UPI000A7D03EE|nr:GNAT family N-acetyltransferase [Alkalihalobacillus pseudalcaliphilus]